MPLPTLYVEGADDISVINALLSRKGLDTERGSKFLRIQDLKSVELLLANMPDAIRQATNRIVGFVLDIDIELQHRWGAVKNRLMDLQVVLPATCPTDGFIGKLPDYPQAFGIWLMPDCRTGELDSVADSPRRSAVDACPIQHGAGSAAGR